MKTKILGFSLSHSFYCSYRLDKLINCTLPSSHRPLVTNGTLLHALSMPYTCNSVPLVTRGRETLRCESYVRKYENVLTAAFVSSVFLHVKNKNQNCSNKCEEKKTE